MQKTLFGRKMRPGQKLTVAEYNGILAAPEAQRDAGRISYLGTLIRGACSECGFSISRNFGCPNCSHKKQAVT